MYLMSGKTDRYNEAPCRVYLMSGKTDGNNEAPCRVYLMSGKTDRYNERSLMSWELKHITHIHLPEDT